MAFSRRQFLLDAGAALFAAPCAYAQAAPAEFKIGYHAITWGDQIEQALDEIAELGYRGVQIRQPHYAKYATRTSEFKDLLAAKKLTLVAISSGNATLNPATMKQEIAERAAMAKWLKEVGGPYLQITDGVRTPNYKLDLDDYRKLGKHLTEIGKRVFNEYGIQLGYHNHMDSLGERRAEVDRIMDATDPKYVWLLPDIAHMHTAGADEVRFVRDYLTRLAFPHFKDVRIQQPAGKTLDGSTVRAKYDFVELGQGQVNVPGVFQIMKDYRYQGWIVIELDRPPAGRAPKESAAISKRYLEEKLRLKL